MAWGMSMVGKPGCACWRISSMTIAGAVAFNGAVTARPCCRDHCRRELHAILANRYWQTRAAEWANRANEHT